MTYPAYPATTAGAPAPGLAPIPPGRPGDAPRPGASPGVAIARFFSRYATFAGRSSRSEYWWIALLNVVVLIGGPILAVVLQRLTAGVDQYGEVSEKITFPAGLTGFIVVLYLLGTLIPNLALSVRRLHDLNLSGWFVLLGLVPTIGGLALLVFAAFPGSPYAARYDRPAR